MNSTGYLAWLAPYFFRSLGFFSLLPLGWGLSAALQRIFWSALFAVLLGPPTEAVAAWSAPGLAVEFLVGMCIALPAVLMVGLGAMWGELFDSGRGQNVAHMYDPMHESHESQMGALSRWLVWVFILYASGMERLVAQLYGSFETLPAGAAGMELGAALGSRVLLGASTLIQGLVVFFLPMAAFFFAVDLALGWMAKILGSMHMISEAFQVKTLLGLGISWLIWQSGGGEAIQAVLNVSFF